VNTLLYQVVHQTPPELGAVAPDTSAALTPVFARALSKRPADRFPSIAAFAKALEDAAALPPTRYKNTLSYPASPGENDDRTHADATIPEETPSPTSPSRAVTPPPAAFADTIRPDQIGPLILPGNTTFSQSARELTPALPLQIIDRARSSRTLVVAAGGIIVLLGVVLGLALRSPRETAPQAMAATAPATPPAPPPAPAPVIEAVPPPKAAAAPVTPTPTPKPRRPPVAPKAKRQLFEEL
jgi:hypothetical protein